MADEDIARRGREYAGIVLPGCEPGEELGQGSWARDGGRAAVVSDG
jgi:hypothetical protein